MARAKGGPLGVKVGLGLDTGASAGVDRLVWTGFSIGSSIHSEQYLNYLSKSLNF